jgi:hypothetical protein
VSNRDAVQDVTWIEQLAAKSDDVGADKAIAVTVSGFTAGAVSAAAAHGILLRPVEDVDLADSLAWLGVRHTTVANRRMTFCQEPDHGRRQRASTAAPTA